jgi:ABC-type transport system involved in multi-copper enzyme maturation permease subunit
MGFLEMLKDSLKESLDRRSLIIVLIIATLFILICAGIGYEQVELDQALKEMERQFTKFAGGRYGHDKITPKFEVSDIRSVQEAPGHEEYEGGTSFQVRAAPLAEFQKHVLFSKAMKGHQVHRSWPEKVPGLSDNFELVEAPPDGDLSAFIAAKLRENNFTRPKVDLEGTAGNAAVFKVWLKPGSVKFLSGSWRMNILFGAMTIDIRDVSIGDVVFMMQNTLAGLIAGWMGIIIAIIATAAFIPNMVQKGTVDLLLARPMPRWRIFLYRYFGGLTYVVIASGYLIVGSWLVIALRSGIWSAGYLWSWPLLVFFFAALYAVSALIGLMTRSAIAAILISAVTWLVLSIIGSVHLFLHSPMAEIEPDHTVVKIVDAAHTVLPRLKDVDQATLLLQLKGNGITPERFTHMHQGAEYPTVEWVPLFGVTGAWMAALLAFGCWIFTRRDY